MTRIATLAANEHLLNLVGRTRSNVVDLQIQVSTGKKSQTYTGIAEDARELVDTEGRKAVLEQFQKNNSLMEMRLNAMAATIDGIDDTLRQFRKLFIDVSAASPVSGQQLEDLQAEAFRALKNVQDYLNTDLDGRYLFSGSRVRTEAFDLPFTTLEQFQQYYDGTKVIYPPTREAHVEMRGELTHADTGNLVITDADAVGGGDTITAATVGAFAALKPGATITISGGDSGNDGTYTVVSIDPTMTQITIDGVVTNALGPVGTPPITVDNSITVGTDTTATITIGNWYLGDQTELDHRLDTQRDFELTTNAIDPAFEKAIRALGIIAQGDAAVGGDLFSHQERIEQAMYLINDALDRTALGTAPFGPEQSGSFESVAMEIGIRQSILSETGELHTSLNGLYANRISVLEDADQTEAITKLLDATQSLEASYQVLARVQQLSLTNFL